MTADLSPTRHANRWAAVMIAIYVLGITPSLGQSLLESHAFRQTQTAYTALLYAERGIDLFRPPLPTLGPPGIIPLEFPLFQALGALVMRAGATADTAMRIAGLLCFLGTAVLLFALAKRIAGNLAAVAALGAFLFNAHAWLYGRASLIEYLATAGGVAFLLFCLRWMETGQRRHWFLAAGAGTVALVVKITTGVFYLLPAFFLRSSQGHYGFQRWSIWTLSAISVAAGLAWSSYAQAVRAETPASAFLELGSQAGWLFGTVMQRLDPAEWRVPLVAFLVLTGSGLIAWAPIAVVGTRRLAQAAFALALVGTAAAAPLVLFNLYAVHDYYFAAIAPQVALAVGIGASWLFANRHRRWVRRTIVGLAGAWVATIIGMSGSWTLVYGTPAEQQQAFRIARYIERHSSRDDWVVLRGLGWNPSFLYYARRQGIAVPDHAGLQDTSGIDLDAILADPRLGPEITCERAGECSVSGR